MNVAIESMPRLEIGPYIATSAGLASVDAIDAWAVLRSGKSVERRLGRQRDEGGEAERADRHEHPVAAAGETQQRHRPGEAGAGSEGGRGSGWARRRGHDGHVAAAGVERYCVHEELLQRRRRAGQGRDPVRAEQLEQPLEVVAPDGAHHVVVGHGDVGDPGQRLDLRRVDGVGQRRADRRPGQVAQLGQRAGLDGAAVADDAHPVAQRLDLGEDVAGQQHGAARPPRSSRDARRWKTASISGSRPEVGSSRRSSSTSEASAATRATFCRLPLE